MSRVGTVLAIDPDLFVLLSMFVKKYRSTSHLSAAVVSSDVTRRISLHLFAHWEIVEIFIWLHSRPGKIGSRLQRLIAKKIATRLMDLFTIAISVWCYREGGIWEMGFLDHDYLYLANKKFWMWLKTWWNEKLAQFNHWAIPASMLSWAKFWRDLVTLLCKHATISVI